jgi:hypothetical protein
MVIFRHHGIFTQGRFQYSAFYVSSKLLRVIQLDLSSGSVLKGEIAGDFNVIDAHNAIALACDREGYIHLAYDHHSTGLRYRRSASPHSVLHWTDELPMTGLHESKVTYPAFVMSPADKPLLFLYRDGVWNKGRTRLKEFSEEGSAWVDREREILSGAEEKPWTANAYWNTPAIGRDNSIHLSYVWRTHSLGPEKRLNNINVCYARSKDHGRTWESSRGRRFQLPITPVNAETVLAVSPGSNLINQCGMAMDGSGNPHIVFYSDDFNGIPQYQHLWFDGRGWRHDFISFRSEPFVLAGGGTLQVPISRPEILIDDDDDVYVIYRGDLTNDCMVAQRLRAPCYEPDPNDLRVLWDKPLGHSEPVVDRLRWRRDRVLSMLIQKSYQPAHDGHCDPIYEPIYLADWRLASDWDR